MTPLFTLVEHIQSLGLKISVYADNKSVFGFGIYQEVNGIANQIGWACFDSSFGISVFQVGAVGVTEYRTVGSDASINQARFAKALDALLGVR